MTYFLDTSALLKRYFAEAGTAAMLALGDVDVAVSPLADLEFRAVVRARERARLVGAHDATAILADWRALAVTWQAFDPLVQLQTEALLDRHPLRAPDAIQLASCMVLRAARPQLDLCFACSDRRLLTAAADERIPCWDPTSS